MFAQRSSRRTLWGRAVSFFGPRALLTWSLLLAILLVFDVGLVEVVSGLEFPFLFLVVIVALTLGWLLALVPIHGAISAVLGLMFGVEFLLMRVGRLGDEVVVVLRAIFGTGGEIIAWMWERVLYLASYSIRQGEFGRELVRSVHWASVSGAVGTLWTGMGTLLSRAGTWFASVVSAGGTFDPVGAALIWGLVVWVCAYWAGWFVSRKNRPLVAVLPAGFVLSFVLAYTWSQPGVLLPLLGLVLILMAMVRHRARESRWDLIGIDFSRDLWGELALLVTGISLALVLMAAVVPTISFEKLSNWIEEMRAPKEEETQTQQVAESLGLEQKPKPQPVQPVRLAQSTDLPRRHLIGSGPELSHIVAFVVETGELPPMSEEQMMNAEAESLFAEEVPRHYWRSLTYDRYLGNGWATSGSEIVEYSAGDVLFDTETVTNTRVLRQAVRAVGELGGLVYADGEIVSMDQDFQVAWRQPNEIFAVTTDERLYQVDGVLPVYTVEQLQAAGTDYPTWITERYLQLPEDVPQRVLTLARDLTATEPTPFDRAVAIESYLREFPYTLDVPLPLAQRDIADFFLFELQKGYCDYYATSMVVLARAAGLPARLVVGYASGRYDYANARYIVTEADAHAWVEIYFPSHGWITFEPTGGRPPIDRPREEAPLIWPEQGGLEPFTPSPPASEQAAPRIVLGQWVLGVLGVIAVVLLGTTGLESALLLLKRSPTAMASALYARLHKGGSRLQVAMHPGDTPYEFGAALIARLLEIAEAHNDGDLLPPAEDEIPVLVDLYVKAWYAPRPVVVEERRTAVWAWWKLRWRLALARLWRKRLKERPEMPGEVDGAVLTTASSPRMPL